MPDDDRVRAAELEAARLQGRLEALEEMAARDKDRPAEDRKSSRPRPGSRLRRGLESTTHTTRRQNAGKED